MDFFLIKMKIKQNLTVCILYITNNINKKNQFSSLLFFDQKYFFFISTQYLNKKKALPAIFAGCVQ